MNRRKFFNMLGAATLGTIIALKIPETIAPINNWINKPKITFAALYKAYNNCRVGNLEPKEILLHPSTFCEAINLINNSTNPMFVSENNWPKFMNAEIKPANIGLHGKLVDMFNFDEVEENEIYVSGDYYGTIGKFYFN